MDEDIHLIQEIKRGNEIAMDSFVRKYYGIILHYCRYHVIEKNIAEDLTQEIFIRFFKRVSKYKHKGKALNYLYVIARNVCIDSRKQLHDKISISETFNYEEKRLSGIETKLVIEQALYKLPEEMREVIILHYFQELTLSEIATILGIGIPLVKYRIDKARKQLKDLLRKEDFT